MPPQNERSSIIKRGSHLQHKTERRQVSLIKPCIVVSFYSTIYNKTVEGVVIQRRLLKKVVMTIVLGEGAEFKHARVLVNGT